MGTTTRQILPLILLIIALCSFPACSQAPSTSTTPPRAAIVDQLYSLQPNEAFISQVTKELEDYGFEVDIYKGDDVTVDFYRQLPGHGYDLIIFRTHSGLLGKDDETIKRTCLFTSEPYSERKHVPEQLSDQLAMARIDKNHPWVFGIGDEFIAHSAEGKFNNTVIIMMGCSCLHLDDLAKAFIDKGASAYLGWDATVDLDYVDKAVPYLVNQLCAEKVSVNKAVTSTMNVIGPDPKHKATLKYYPSESAHKTLKELIK
jgi:hypothetical protein